jgi:hypothetical protein
MRLGYPGRSGKLHLGHAAFGQIGFNRCAHGAKLAQKKICVNTYFILDGIF